MSLQVNLLALDLTLILLTPILFSYFGGSIEDARKAIEENYSGCYKSQADYAEELTEGTAQIPRRQIFALVLLAGRQKFAPPILTGLVG